MTSEGRAAGNARPNTRLAEIAAAVITCRACPRLVAWREAVAADPPLAHRDETYWARPVPGFGDPYAPLVIVGLAPAAQGANRTGRLFTGDRSGDFLFAALHRAGLASRPESTALNDGLTLDGVYVTAAVRCAPPDNKPTPLERDTCGRFLADELGALARARVVLALGAFAFDAVLRATPSPRTGPRPRFADGVEIPIDADGRQRLVGVYHPSQRNVFTGLLTAEMFDAVLARALALSTASSEVL